jgi:hypothetical protein
MCSKWICCLGIAIGLICCECTPRRLRAKDPPNNQEKWLFLLDQIRSHGEQLKSGECTITGRMYSPERPGKTILIDHKFEIRLAFVRPTKCKWEGHIPGWILDPQQAGVDENGNPTAGYKFGEQTALFATNGPDGAWWDADHGDWIILLPRSTAETHLDRTLYFPDIAYLTLYTSSERMHKLRSDELINVLKKQQNVSIDDSSPVWKVRWAIPVKLKETKMDVVTVMDVDTENGFTVTKLAYIVHRPDGKEEVQEQLTAKWEHQNGAFVPSHYTTQLGFKEGNNYITTEADVTWSSVNAPLSDSLFEWGSFEVPQGTGVLDARTQNPKFIKMMARASAPSPEPEGRKWSWWIIGNVTVALVVLVIYLYRRHVRRRAVPT